MPLDLDAATWAELSALLDQALDMPATERAAWIESLDERNAGLKPRLRSLLAPTTGGVETADFVNTLPRLEPLPNALPGGTPPALAAGDLVGPYRLVRPLAAGGMATVWLALRADGLIGRPLAIKFPHAAYQLEALRQRMAREREILAALDHPHIARLYDAGFNDRGDPYLVMEYVEGEAIDDYCRTRALDIRARVQLMLQVADAVAYAHSRLVVHRDLKPANIWVTPDGQVKLLDFGIATLTDGVRAERSALTEWSGAGLTPDYASPEQILGQPVGTASDVYSLGVLLHELLAGRRPYRLQRESRGALEQAILAAEPQRPSEQVDDPGVRRALAGDLDTIVQKALRKSPTERYVTVSALAEDLERHLANRPILAQPDSGWYRVGKFVRRNRLAVGVAGAVVVAIVSTAAVAVWQARVATAERERAEQVRGFLTSLFENANPYAAEGREVSAAELLQQARSRIAALGTEQQALRVELLNVIGTSLLGLGEHALADEVGTQAVAESGSLPAGDVLRLRSLVLHTDTHVASDRAPELKQELDLLVPRLEADRERYADELLRAYLNRVHLYILKDEPLRARQAGQAAFDFALRHFGKHDPRTVLASNLRAEAGLYDESDPDANLIVADEALRFATAAYGGSAAHPRMAESREIYARSLSQAHREQPAIEQWYQAMREARAALGPGSYLEGTIAINMLPSLRRSGRIKEAQQVADLGMGIIDRHVQHESHTFATHATVLGTIALAARRGDRAIPHLADAVAILGKLLGPTNGDTLTAQANLALAMAYDGQLEKSRQLLQWVEAEYRRSMPEYINYVHYIAGVRWRLAGNAPAAIAAQREALATSPAGDFGGFSRLRAMTELALSEAEARQPAAALATLRELKPLLAAQLAVTAPFHAEAWLAGGRALLAQGRVDESVVQLRQAYAFWHEFDATHREAGEAAWWLARALAQQGDAAAAAGLQRSAQEILRRSPLPRDRGLLSAPDIRRGQALPAARTTVVTRPG